MSLLNQLSQGSYLKSVTYVDICLIKGLLLGAATDVSYEFNDIHVTDSLVTEDAKNLPHQMVQRLATFVH